MPSNVLALQRDSGERFVFLYDSESYDVLLKIIDRYVADQLMDEGEANCLREKAWQLWWREISCSRSKVVH